MAKKWQIKPSAPEDFINKYPEMHPIILNLLYNRGLMEENEFESFLNPDYNKNLFSAFIFKHAKKAVKRLLLALEKQQKIVIYGDYDADGVTSASVLYLAFKELGANIEVYIPHREKEGYGLNENAVRKFSEEKVDLIITVDCGISNINEVELAKSLGIDVIITDHHHAPEKIPKALAIINPNVEDEKYPFKSLAGVGVSFKFVQAFFQHLKEKNKDEKFNEKLKNIGGLLGFEKWLLDLVAIGTVADCVPLISENRVLVKYGLIVLKKTKRKGLLELLNLISIDKNKIDAHSIGFQIAPRINAVGRLKHAMLAHKLLVSEEAAEVEELAKVLHEVNSERQKTTETIVLEIQKQRQRFEDKFLFAFGNEWPVGIVGLAAGKLADEHRMPVIVMTRNGAEITGSGRSIPEFNIIKAMEKVNHCFSRYGGHSQACGFTLKSEAMMEEFTLKLKGIAFEELKDKDLSPTMEIDAKINLEEMDWNLINSLEKFEPYGEGNRKPIFLTENLKIMQISQIGQDGKHLRIFVNDQKSPKIQKMIGFYLGSYFNSLSLGDTIDVVYEAGINEWNGNREIEMKIVDLKKI